VEENINIDVFDKIEGNYLQSSKYAKAQVNVLDEVPLSYSHQGNPELDQTRHTFEKWDHEYVHLEVIQLFLRVCALCEEEGHVIMDCPLMPFYIKASITKDVKLQNVVGALMDQL
jgi:hypothetical protein